MIENFSGRSISQFVGSFTILISLILLLNPKTHFRSWWNTCFPTWNDWELFKSFNFSICWFIYNTDITNTTPQPQNPLSDSSVLINYLCWTGFNKLRKRNLKNLLPNVKQSNSECPDKLSSLQRRDIHRNFAWYACLRWFLYWWSKIWFLWLHSRNLNFIWAHCSLNFSTFVSFSFVFFQIHSHHSRWHIMSTISGCRLP